MTLPTLPADFATTRDAVHRLACYVIAPARKAITGRIGLRPADGGFATPDLPAGGRLQVSGDRIIRADGESAPITTISGAATFVGHVLTDRPDIGNDLPRFAPDETLAVSAAATKALGDWYAFGAARLLELTGDVSEAQIWPEHFDLAVVVRLASGRQVNVGFSPGDGFCDRPYAYIGPFDNVPTNHEYWNAPFGAYQPLPSEAAAIAFIGEGLARLAD